VDASRYLDPIASGQVIKAFETSTGWNSDNVLLALYNPGVSGIFNLTAKGNHSCSWYSNKIFFDVASVFFDCLFSLLILF
jgi:hypothetical protein